MKNTFPSLPVFSFAALLIATSADAQVASTLDKDSFWAPGIRGGLAASTHGGVGSGLPRGAVGSAMIGSAVHGGSANTFMDFSESIGMKQERLRLEASAREDGAARAPAGQVEATMVASGFLEAGSTATRVRDASVSIREEMYTQLNSRIDASANAMAALGRRSSQLRGESRAEFAAALKDAQAREKQLRSSLQTSRTASPETWADSRSAVAADYEAYAAAVSRAEAIAASVTAEAASRQ